MDHCPRCGGFLVREILFDGQGWSNFNVSTYKCLMCARYFEGSMEYGIIVGTLADARCYGARQGGGKREVDDEMS